MKRKVEIERLSNIDGPLGRQLTQYEVRGYIMTEAMGGWTGVLLSQDVVPTAFKDSQTKMTRSQAMSVANMWFRLADEQCERLVLKS